jgi:hypothetical protein
MKQLKSRWQEEKEANRSLPIGSFHVQARDGGTEFVQGYEQALQRLRHTIFIDGITDADIYDFVRVTMHDSSMTRSFRAGMVAGYIAGLHLGSRKISAVGRTFAKTKRKRNG